MKTWDDIHVCHMCTSTCMMGLYAVTVTL